MLVRVAYSAVSVGTELAALRPPETASAPTLASRAGGHAELFRARLEYAWKNPARAFARAQQIARRRLESHVRPATDASAPSTVDSSGIRGWALGYSAAGHVVAVGADVADLVPGDPVACAGAGYANHAELVSVPRNLVSRVPAGCDLRWAATTTLGAIALQGVRRRPAADRRERLRAGSRPARAALRADAEGERLPRRGARSRPRSAWSARSRRRSAGSASPTSSAAWCGPDLRPGSRPHGDLCAARSNERGAARRTADARQGTARDRRRHRARTDRAVFYEKEMRSADEHVLRSRPLRPELRGEGHRLPVRTRALDRQPQHAGVPRLVAAGRLQIEPLDRPRGRRRHGARRLR